MPTHHNKTQAINRILRALEGRDIPNDDPEGVTGEVLSEDDALSDIARLMGGYLPGEQGIMPSGIRERPAILSDSKSFYVIPDHPNANDLNSGENPAFPLEHVAQAWANVRAYHGDEIWVTSSDSWQYSEGTQTGIVESLIIPHDKPGVAMYGVSRGSEGCYWRPTGSAGWCIWVQALDTIIDGFCFWASADTCNGIYLDWQGAGAAYGENTIISNNTFSDDCEIGVQMEYTWYCDIYNNRFQQCDLYGIAVSASGSGVKYVRIYDNWFNDCVGPAMLLNGCDNGLIRSNHIYNGTAQATGTCTNLGINTASGSANLVEDNYFSCIIEKFAEFNSGSPTDAWIFNHCLNGEATFGPG